MALVDGSEISVLIRLHILHFESFTVSGFYRDDALFIFRSINDAMDIFWKDFDQYIQRDELRDRS
uniref:Uncharacterized protein n=1 Tax=Octopus bimaculoides TaxID=37653 RepID=A0A0L8IAP1_OCTBM